MEHGLKRQRILIVDDVPANIRILAEALRREADILAVTSGREALELVRVDPPDLILLDVVMPDMDGHEVLRRLKCDLESRDVPVIFITSRTEAEDEIKGLELGAVDYIAKPFALPVVQARVRTHLALKRKSDMLDRLASIDGLTTIPNRRRLDEHLEEEWRRALRCGYPLGLVLLDIDHFKLYNDNYGHARGDDCLRAVAASLARSLRRPGDLAARYGGEEFAAVLPGADAAGAAEVAETIRAGIEALGLEHAFSPVCDRVTASVGAASVVPWRLGGPMMLLEAADAMLYAAKKSGRNRTLVREIRPEADALD